ncbi:uncharacterized protein sb:cb288 [Epinephelus moara]|uniref:uncharacterized protein sb:cb288 n=1 Tax=Epinephelus moara TaxID=300413 RepID=UPI00214EF7AB|nr:uncharacterized protein sb:cb288 [Epinephelus moara]
MYHIIVWGSTSLKEALERSTRYASGRTAEVSGRKHDELMKSDRTASKMWTEVKNKSKTITSSGNSSKMVDPDLTRQLLHTVQHRNGSTAAATHPGTEDSIASSSGIIPGAIAATVFIVFLLGLYAVLWKCMVSPPQRKHNKVRVRVHQRTTV